MTGIHHITMISGDPIPLLGFYRDVLGLRLVKRTVNFDDPGTYHLYLGDATGSPGTILTFFPYVGARPGRPGVGQANAIGLTIPQRSVGWWLERLAARNLPVEKRRRLDGRAAGGAEHVYATRDPDGLTIELVPAAPEASPRDVEPWQEAPVPAEHAVRGVQDVTLWVDDAQPTLDVLALLGFDAVGEADNTHVLEARDASAGQTGRQLRVRGIGQFLSGAPGAGSIHHVAVRCGGPEQQLEARQRLIDHGLGPTDVIDRNYFESVYCREPGGVLLEVATDPPGFAVDEPVESLGSELKLPPQYEPHRSRIAAGLPALERGADADADGPLGLFTYHHRASDPASRQTLLLLHGTGGDERSLLGLADKLDPSAAVLAPRGRVMEGSMPRFFRRLREGVFDEDDVRAQAKAMADWLPAAAGRHELDPAGVTAVGYSNGANIAAAVMLLHPATLRRAILMRPMAPLADPPKIDLTGCRVLMLVGAADPISGSEPPARLHQQLADRGAVVDWMTMTAGHELTGEDLHAATAWLRANPASPGVPGSAT